MGEDKLVVGDKVALTGGSYKKLGYGKVVRVMECKVSVYINDLKRTADLMKKSVTKVSGNGEVKSIIHGKRGDDTMDKLMTEIRLHRLEMEKWKNCT